MMMRRRRGDGGITVVSGCFAFAWCVQFYLQKYYSIIVIAKEIMLPSTLRHQQLLDHCYCKSIIKHIIRTLLLQVYLQKYYSIIVIASLATDI